MSWLYIDTDENRVCIKPEAVSIPEVQKIYKKDRRNETKPYFNKVITYVYHCYAPDHAFSNSFPEQRRRRVADVYFNGDDVLSLEDDKDVRALIDAFKHDCMGPSERFYENLKKDMEDLINYIQTIPMFTEIKVEKSVPVKYVDNEGQLHETTVDVKVPVSHDNSKIKMDAIKRADELLELEEKMRQRVKSEKRKKKQTRSLFDQ